MVRGGHLKGKVARHTNCYGNTWYVMLAPEEMEKSLGMDEYLYDGTGGDHVTGPHTFDTVLIL